MYKLELGVFKAPGRKDPARVGLVGCGYIAEQVHIPLWKKVKQAELVALCDVVGERVAMMSKRFGVKRCYLSLSEMLKREELDVLDVCVPPQAHAVAIEEALKAGVNCIVEKPLTVTVEEADRVIGLAKSKGLKLFVLHNYSFMPAARWLRDIVQKGGLGEMKLLETHYFTPLGAERYAARDHWIHSLPGGVLNSEILPHLLMLVLEYMDDVSDVDVSLLKVSNLGHISADELHIILRSASGRVARVGLSYNSTLPIHTMQVAGTRGAAFLDFFTQAVEYHRLPKFSQTDEVSINSYERGKWALSDIWQRWVRLVSVSGSVLLGRYTMRTEGHRYLMSKAIKSLLDRDSYPVDLAKCRETVNLIECVARSLESVKHA